MKRLLLPLLITVFLGLACPFSGGIGTGSQVESLLGDPRAGLASLDNYRAELTISFEGTRDGQPLELTDAYVQTEWPAQAAKFTTIDALNEGGDRQVTLVGSVGEAQYYQADGVAPCEVTWGALAGGPTDFRLAFLLPAVGTARSAGEQVLDDIATRHYTFDTASLSLPEGAAATGEAWIAKDGGYLFKYVLDITGADSVFGAGAQGTRHVEYLLSEVGAHPDVVYPQGCEPVLGWPATEDATDLVRLPGLLAYTTGASMEAVFAFYAEQLPPLDWEQFSEPFLGANSGSVIFVRTGRSASAIIAVDTEGSSRRVTVMAPDQSPGTVPTPVPGAQETAMAQNPGIRVALAFSVLFGMLPEQPGPSSYHLEATHRSPIWDGSQIAERQEEMSADLEGGNVHYTRRITPPGGSTTTSEAYLMGDQEYAVEGGQVQPPADDSLTWMLWSTKLGLLLSSSSSGATSAGMETLDGRPAEIYAIDSSGLSVPGVPGNLLPITSVTGNVWVDQATGALLKAVLDYQADVGDNSGTLKGSGAGHLEITVTQVGNVTVALP